MRLSVTEERRAILELLKICKWLADDNRWQSVWDEIDAIKDEWETEEFMEKKLDEQTNQNR